MTDPLDHPPADHGSDRYGYVELTYAAGVSLRPRPPEALVDSLRCPDCLSNLFLHWDGLRWLSTVAHDEGCPTLARLEAGEDPLP